MTAEVIRERLGFGASIKYNTLEIEPKPSEVVR